MKASLSPASDESRRARRRLFRLTLWIALLGSAFATPTARATPPSGAEVEAARGTFAEGIALEASGRWAQALERFERTATVCTSPQVSFHRGLCLEHLGRLVDALDAFLSVERDALGDTSARRVGGLAGAHIAGLRKRVPVLVLRAPVGSADAKVLLDGKPLTAGVLEMPRRSRRSSRRRRSPRTRERRAANHRARGRPR